MAKITQSGALVDPFNLPRPELITETRTFTDDNVPGAQVELTLQSSGDFTLPMAVSIGAKKLISTYGAKNAIPIMVGGRKVEVTEELCYFIALLQTLETEPSSFEFWAATSATMPYAMAEIAVWAEGLLNREPQVQASEGADGSRKAELPNDSGVGSDLPLGPQLNTENTPNLSPDATP